jgi:catechol 2,3-dioxygenase-like lactoylglutathione lyase family enzyme
VNINGIAHVQLSVCHFEACRAFYRQLLPFFEMKAVIDTDTHYYAIGGRTGLCICRAATDDPFVQTRAGLHHLCFRLRSREDVDALHAFLVGIGARIVHAPELGMWAPGYYSVLFEDPDGIRLEANFVPGKGHLEVG